jgi:PPK2 family polyphosphate:nucleotide phosphotransferase
MKIDADALVVEEDKKLRLEDRPTEVKPLYESKEDYEEALADHSARIACMHERLFAAARNGLLVVFQGMDTSGKDGAIKHVMSAVNPQGCRVASFKVPTPLEKAHDFLCRVQPFLPERGAISVFNRSHYEAVLVERVHPRLLAAEGEARPKDLDAFFDTRFRAIRDFERHLVENGTAIVKVFLHISKAEQKKRLLERLDDPEKNWKASMADVEERGFWKDYRRVYEQALAGTSTKSAPWYVVPGDDKKNARLFVSRILLDAFEGLNLEGPKPDADRRRELKEIREKLEG